MTGPSVASADRSASEASSPALPGARDFSAALAWSVPVGAIVSLPALARGAGAGAWCVAALCCAVQAGVFAALFRAAGPSRRLIDGATAVLLAVGPLVLVGQQLYSKTHHRPLGAATFVVAAALVLAGCWAVVVRSPKGAGVYRDVFRWAFRGASILSVGLLLAFAAQGGVAAHLIDAGLLVVGVVALVRLPAFDSAPTVGSSVVGAAGLALAGIALAAPALLKQALLAAPVPSALVALLLGA